MPTSERHGESFLNFPLGISYILSNIRKHFSNCSINVLDINKEFVTNETDIRKRFEGLKSFSPDYILFGGMITRYSCIKLISTIFREIFPDSVQVVGGSIAATGHRQLMLKSTIDVFVIGEGEETIIEILEGKNFNKIKGVAFKNHNGTVQINPSRERVKDLDALPKPAYDMLDTKSYIDNNYHNTGWRYMPLIGSRGCPFSCNFCYKNFGGKMIYRSPEMVVDELKYLKSNYFIDSFYLLDEIQFLNKNWMRLLAEHLLKNNLNLKYTVVSRATLFKKRDRQKDLKLLGLCKKSGLLRISLGIESGNQKILDAMNKNCTVDQIEYAIRLIREAGIKATGSMLIGYPGETKYSIQDSVDFAHRNLLKTSFYCLIPLPSTSLYDYCLQNNIIADENTYLEKISAHGDASHIYINLTSMTDEEYFQAVSYANVSVNKIPMTSYLKYYGLKKGVASLMLQKMRDLKRSLSGRVFETP